MPFWFCPVFISVVKPIVELTYGGKMSPLLSLTLQREISRCSLPLRNSNDG
ncbi:hypothetical protein AT1219_70025 [Vibrio alginolyticus]